MTTLLYTHPICVEHEPGDQHPERPDRLRAVQAALDGDDFAGLERREAPRAEVADIENVHEAHYVEDVFENVPESGRVHLDPDTALSPASGEAALRAAGARHGGGRRGARRRGQECFLRGQAAGTPRRVLAGHGVLPLQQRRHRRPACVHQTWAGAGGRR